MLRLGWFLLAAILLLGACSGDDADGEAITDTDTTAAADDGSSTSSSSPGATSTTSTDPDTDTTGETTSTSQSTTTTTTTSSSATTDGDRQGGSGTITVRLEPVQGYFIEGFEVGLRFETATGQMIASTLWTDFVETLDDPSIDDYYEAVLTQPVPAGDVVVSASVNIGAGPPPEVPDLNRPLRCELTVEVPAGGEVAVEVLFARTDCLRLG